jgi:hypothetical protein
VNDQMRQKLFEAQAVARTLARYAEQEIQVQPQQADIRYAAEAISTLLDEAAKLEGED